MLEIAHSATAAAPTATFNAMPELFQYTVQQVCVCVGVCVCGRVCFFMFLQFGVAVSILSYYSGLSILKADNLF